MAKVNLSSPWVNFHREIDAMFGSDPEINVVYDEKKNAVRLYVNNAAKAEALETLLPAERQFGNVTMTVEVIPANEPKDCIADLFRTAFQDNPVFAYTKTGSDPITNDFTYVVFKNKVVQYFIDNLHDVHGNRSTLYQEIARDIFGETNGIFFCTDTEEKVGGHGASPTK